MGFPQSTHSAEYRLLLVCARVRLQRESSKQLPALVNEITDWDRLFDVAERHSMLPLLYMTLSNYAGEQVSRGFLDRLKIFYERNRLENLYLVKELHKLTRLLEANNIPAIPYKGPVLGKFLHDNYSTRHAGDLDILVSPSNLLPAAEILLSAGFSSDQALTRRQRIAYLKYSSGHHLNFSKSEPNLNVELHWNIAQRHIVSNVMFEEMLNKAIADEGDISFRLLAADDLILMLNVHLRSHTWSHLDLLFDMASLIHKSEHLDWEILFSRAKHFGGSNSLLLSLKIIRTLFKTDNVACEQSRSKAKIELEQFSSELVERLPSATARNNTDFNFDSLLIQTRAINGRWARLRNIGEVVLRPNLWDVVTLDLPRWLGWAYFVIRPWRLLAKFGMRLISYGISLVRATFSPSRVKK